MCSSEKRPSSDGSLQELWDLIDEMCVEDVVMDMAGFGVVYAEHRELDDGTTVLELRLYDIVRDFARQEAKKQGEETMWPAKLLDAYRAAYGAEEPSPLWIFNVKSDEVGGYKTQNVCRLLSAAWRSDEIGSILHSARWSVKMQESSKIAQLEDDVQLYSRKTPQKYRAEVTRWSQTDEVLLNKKMRGIVGRRRYAKSYP